MIVSLMRYAIGGTCDGLNLCQFAEPNSPSFLAQGTRRRAEGFGNEACSAGLAAGRRLSVCGRLGSIAAAEVISHYGARPVTDLRPLAAAVG